MTKKRRFKTDICKIGNSLGNFANSWCAYCRFKIFIVISKMHVKITWSTFFLTCFPHKRQDIQNRPARGVILMQCLQAPPPRAGEEGDSAPRERSESPIFTIPLPPFLCYSIVVLLLLHTSLSSHRFRAFTVCAPYLIIRFTNPRLTISSHHQVGSARDSQAYSLARGQWKTTGRRQPIAAK